MSNVIRVSAASATGPVSGCIAGRLRTEGMVVVRAIGAAAVNQAVKAIILAGNYLTEERRNLAIDIEFCTLTVNEAEVTGIQFNLSL